MDSRMIWLVTKWLPLKTTTNGILNMLIKNFDVGINIGVLVTKCSLIKVFKTLCTKTV